MPASVLALAVTFGGPYYYMPSSCVSDLPCAHATFPVFLLFCVPLVCSLYIPLQRLLRQKDRLLLLACTACLCSLEHIYTCLVLGFLCLPAG
jgi:hypothetical protein